MAGKARPPQLAWALQNVLKGLDLGQVSNPNALEDLLELIPEAYVPDTSCKILVFFNKISY
ncbi:MAG: hypothetical protein E7B11_11315 [Clostridiales bacterium]|uniref:hypothetical protein n=1 Tax=Robinsoniella sp. TaxID=2496533 RepID=UPI0029096C9C|nr:hypothetical protein [Clostridiales bacterium]MDU3241144.1 hypothetical protein [Clostridiales bacterium]